MFERNTSYFQIEGGDLLISLYYRKKQSLKFQNKLYLRLIVISFEEICCKNNRSILSIKK